MSDFWFQGFVDGECYTWDLLIGKFHFLVAEKTRAVDRSKGVITSRDGTGIHVPRNAERNFVRIFNRSIEYWV